MSFEAFQHGPVRGYCHPALLPHLDFFIDWEGADFKSVPRQFHILKVYLERPNWVAAVRLPFPDLPWNIVLVKRFGSRSPLHRLLSPFTESKALRAFRMALEVQKIGLLTPQPLLALESRRIGLVGRCYSITAWLPEASSAREKFKSHSAPGGPESPEIKNLLIVLARIIRKLHDAGILHRDLTLGNFLIPRNAPDQVHLIDLSRAVQLKRLPILFRLMDLARMNLGPHWPAFYHLYCGDRPDWLRYKRLLDGLVRLRRTSIVLRKIKKAFSPAPR
jgi:hypothetical protein